MITRVAKVMLPTEYGDFVCYAYEVLPEEVVHLALVKGEVSGKKEVLVRMHSECLTGDVFHSKRCDCGAQLDSALKKIAEAEYGLILYLRGHEGRGIGLKSKLKAYELQEQGKDTVEANLELGWPADLREYSMGAQMLTDLGVQGIRLLTNNPAKAQGLAGYGFEVATQPLLAPINKENQAYLKTKKNKLGHLIDF